MGGSGATITTMLGRPISSKVDSLGHTVLNDVSTIISEDNEVTNGLVHKINNVVPRTSRLLGDTFERLEGYSIFSEALHKTGLADSIAKSVKYRTLADGTRTTKFTNLLISMIPMVANSIAQRNVRLASLYLLRATKC